MYEFNSGPTVKIKSYNFPIKNSVYKIYNVVGLTMKPSVENVTFYFSLPLCCINLLSSACKQVFAPLYCLFLANLQTENSLDGV